jgi:urease accessory protein
VQALEGVLRIRDDHVIADMVAGLGGRVMRLRAPFDPETGAYAGTDQTQGHGHGHDH